MLTKMIRQVVAQSHGCITALLAETDNAMCHRPTRHTTEPLVLPFLYVLLLLLPLSHHFLSLLSSLCPAVFDYTIPVNPVYLH